MIVGIGVDVVSTQRFGAALARTPALLGRLFTPAEQRLPPASLAARFAAKEAVAKALGAPAGLRWRDVEVLVGPGGQPSVHATGSVAERARMLGASRWHLSLSHDAGLAVAVAVAERADPAR